jgi:nifR3 family TIM-barrel protein
MVFPPVSIDKVYLSSPVLMAPMVGLSTRPFRILALRHGCALAAGEMIASEYLVRTRPDQRREFRVWEEERPSALQIVGSRVEAMVDAGRMLEDFGARIVDINMGCPVRKIVKGGGGVALMRNPERAARIVTAIRDRVSVPVTVKIRAGWDEGEMVAPQFAKRMEEAGAAAIAVHARVSSRKHSGAPRLDVIAAVKEAVDVPVIGNGGLKTPEDARHMLEVTGCDAVMFGRGAIGDVWLFDRTARYLETGEMPPAPSPEERHAVFSEHLRLLAREYGAERGVVRFRKCVPHYLKGVRGAREARHSMLALTDPDEVIAAAARILLAGCRDS